MPGVLAVYHAGGDDLGLAPFQSFPMLAETLQPAGVRPWTVSASSATSSPPSWPRPAAQAVDAAEAVVVDVDPLPVVVSQAAALAPDAPLLFPDSGQQRVLRHRLRRRRATRSRGPRSSPRCPW